MARQHASTSSLFRPLMILGSPQSKQLFAHGVDEAQRTRSPSPTHLLHAPLHLSAAVPAPSTPGALDSSWRRHRFLSKHRSSPVVLVLEAFVS